MNLGLRGDGSQNYAHENRGASCKNVALRKALLSNRLVETIYWNAILPSLKRITIITNRNSAFKVKEWRREKLKEW
jgi:hypothetical protein